MTRFLILKNQNNPLLKEIKLKLLNVALLLEQFLRSLVFMYTNLDLSKQAAE